MADHRLITDRYLRALPPAPNGQRVEVFDSRVPGFGIRISDTKDADPARRGKAGTHQLRPVRPVLARCGTDPPRHRHLWRDHAGEARRTAGEWRSRSTRASTLPWSRRKRVRRQRVSGHCASGIRSATSRRLSSRTSCRRSAAARRWSATSAPSSSPHGATDPSTKSPSSMCWRSSTPRSAPRRRWPARC